QDLWCVWKRIGAVPSSAALLRAADCHEEDQREHDEGRGGTSQQGRAFHGRPPSRGRVYAYRLGGLKGVLCWRAAREDFMKRATVWFVTAMLCVLVGAAGRGAQNQAKPQAPRGEGGSPPRPRYEVKPPDGPRVYDTDTVRIRVVPLARGLD